MLVLEPQDTHMGVGEAILRVSGEQQVTRDE